MRQHIRTPTLFVGAILIAVLGVGGRYLLGRVMSGASDVTVVTANAPEPRPADYASFGAALVDLDPGAARALATSDDQRDLASALAAVLDEDSTADLRLEALRGARDPVVRRMGLEMLGQLLLAQERWPAFVALADSEPGLLERGSLTRGDLMFARALAGASPERFVFKGVASVATRPTLSGCPEIVVRINGRIQHLVLDTGSSVSVLAGDVAHACGVEPIGTEVATGEAATGATVTFRPAVIEQLAIGTLTIENHPVTIVDPEVLTFRIAGLPVMKFDGILGWPAFRGMSVRIDLNRGWSTFTRALSWRRGPRNLYWLGDPIITLRTEGGRRLNFGLDTGAAHSRIRPRFFDKFPNGDFGRVDGPYVRDIALHMDGRLLRFRELGTTPGIRGAAIWKPDGELGYDVGGGGTVVVDWPAGRFEIEP